MYKSFRNDNGDISLIAKQTGWEVDDIKNIKNYLFFKKMEKWDGTIELLDPDYEIAMAWDRLQKGNFYDNDILLLKHELYEKSYMDINKCKLADAHSVANSVFNWQKK